MVFPQILLGVCSGMRFYRLALDWTPAEALKYLLKLALLLALVGTPIFLRNSYLWADSALEQMEQSKALPEFFIEKGRVRTALPQPYSRLFRDFALVLDTANAKPQVPAGAPLASLSPLTASCSGRKSTRTRRRLTSPCFPTAAWTLRICGGCSANRSGSAALLAPS
jgi:hypothetical protein